MRAKKLTAKDLADIVARASTIEERLRKEFAPAGGYISDDLIDSRLKTWRRSTALDDGNGFLQRLAYDDLDVESAKIALGPFRLKAKVALPAWAAVLKETEKTASKMAEGYQTGRLRWERFLDKAAPVPFEDILAPFVLTARNRLVVLAGEAYGLLSGTAHAVLERNLLERLADFAAQVLYLEFSILRDKELPPAARSLAQLLDPDDRSIYKRFVSGILTKGLTDLLQEYAVLARLMASTVCTWTSANSEFLARLAADWADLSRICGTKGKHLGEVASIQPLLPDPLRGERIVLSLTFVSGRKLVYKPKDLGAEAAFFQLLAWANEKGLTPPLQPLQLLCRPTHGWIEHVEHLPCRTAEEARRYYLRSGMLLCLTYVLKGFDFHHKNVIASGENPVLIDLETLLQHRARPDFKGGADARYLDFEQLMNSVIYTGLLPAEITARKDGDKASDVSGLGGEGLPDPHPNQCWVNINTNEMAPGPKAAEASKHANIPLLNGVPLRLEDFTEEIITGFQKMYRFLELHRDSLLSPGSPLMAMAKLKVRFIYRSTRAYTAIFKELCAPKYLRDGADFGIGLEFLARKHLAGVLRGLEPAGPAPLMWPVLAAEKRALQQGKIPYFTACADSPDLETAPGWVIKECFSEPGFERAIACLQGLDDADLERQLGLIRSSLQTGKPNASGQINTRKE